ncbi:uncharacterized protein [Henckelia pumila]|uniref:uncharacterized protein isoform X2 n=1 Tax=Henckelia pumila TaxID=405737 RepID=UPI003C6DF22E
MEALGILKFWRNAIADDEDDSFFDLVLKPPAGSGGGGLKKEFQFIESPSDVLRSTKNDFIISKPLSPAVTLLRSTPKFKVFMLGFRKSSRSQKSEPEANSLNQLSESSKVERSSNRFSAKCGEVSVSSALTRDHSLRSRIAKELISDSDSDALSREKSVPIYLKLMRPFHVKASKKAKVTDSVTPFSSPVNLYPRKLSDGYRARSKSRSAAIEVETPSYRRRDDSLLEQHDGILGAILHCKRSYTCSSTEFSQLFESAMDSSGRSSL